MYTGTADGKILDLYNDTVTTLATLGGPQCTYNRDLRVWSITRIRIILKVQIIRSVIKTASTKYKRPFVQR